MYFKLININMYIILIYKYLNKKTLTIARVWMSWVFIPLAIKKSGIASKEAMPGRK